MEEYTKAPEGFISLIENKYQLKVIDSHYIMVDKIFRKYNMMLYVKFNPQMEKAFKEKYENESSAMHVAWEEREDGIKFYAEIGNNILLLWDSVSES